MTTGDGAATDRASTDLLERFDLASASPVEDRVAELKALFPEAFREGRLDLNALSRSVGDWVDPGPERFGLTWPGKAECMRAIQQPSVGTILPVREESVDFDATQNVIIEGDNLEVLKLLQKSYYGEIKFIYIDPPYNTGKEFIYPDNFREGLQDYLRYSKQVGIDGGKLNANAETDGRYHSKWLSMMYPRLYLARNLLREDGILFVSIDDHEVDNLKKIGTEIFGEENFLGLACRVAKKTNNKGDYWSPNFDYVATFARNAALTAPFFGGVNLAAYDQVDTDGPRNGERYQLVRLYMSNIHNRNPEQRFFIECPDGSEVIPPGSSYPPERPVITDGIWRWTRSKFDAERDRIVIKTTRSSNLITRSGAAADWNVYTKTYLSDVIANSSAKPNALLEPFLNQLGSEEMGDLGIPFDYPKPSALIKHLMEISKCSNDDIVLDFFAGSGTTAHAVLDLNQADGGERRFILVQLPEPTGHAEFPTIADICRERVRRVIAKLDSANDGSLGLMDRPSASRGFRSFKLAASSFAIWDGANTDATTVQERLKLSVDNIDFGRSEESLLTELLVKAGYPLTAKVEELAIAEQRVFSIDDNSLLICLEPALTVDLFEAMADLGPSLIIVMDAGFGNDDQLKVNALQTIRSRKTDSQSFTELKVV